MSSSEPMREFFETVAVAARAARETLVQRTIEQHAPRARERVAQLREQHPEMSNEGVADLLIRDYGVWNALNLDGGGSTTLVIRGRVANHPSDSTGERKVGNALLVTRGRRPR